MKTEAKIQALLAKIRIIPDETALQAEFARLKPGAPQRPVRVAFINAHAINLCYNSPVFLENLMECDCLYRDGSGMKILFKLLRRNPGLNLNGTDLIPRIVALYEGQGVALLGTQTPYLERATENIASLGAKPVVQMDGFQPEPAYGERLQTHTPPLILLAMGMPKQERVAAQLSRKLDFPCLIVCGGAILDLLGGKVKRAPLFYQHMGMEWLYRLMQEPKRLFRRYLIGNGIFLLRSLRLACLNGRS